MTEKMPPNGQLRVVGVDELFFSTTDRKGVINGANSVFARLSQYPRSELLGAPHNIIRHPQMPGGAFEIMWQLLLSGRPMAAYVQNLAKDGYTYWVFATITPLGDGFLSVRSAPCCESLWQVANQLYTEVLPIEAEARRNGHSRAEAALIGAQAITERVQALGFPSYEDFIRHALPEEVTARAALSQYVPRRNDTYGDLGVLLGTTYAVNGELSRLLDRLGDFQALAESLDLASNNAATTIGSLRQASDTASRASSTVEDRVPVLARTATAMTVRCGEAAQTMENLATELAKVRSWILELRFRIGLARLHNDMVTNFAREVVDGQAPPEGLSYVPFLCTTLQEGIEAVNLDMSTLSSTLRSVTENIDRATEQLRDFQHLLATWRLLVPRFQMSPQLGPYVSPIDSQLMQGHEQMASLRDLAAQCLAEAQPFDPEPLRNAITRISQVAEAVQETAPATEVH